MSGHDIDFFANAISSRDLSFSKGGDRVLLACRQVVDIKVCFMPKKVDFT